MYLVIKSDVFVDQIFDDVSSCRVEVERSSDGKIYYYVIVVCKDCCGCVSTNCTAAYLDVEHALSVAGQINDGLERGKKRLEVKV